MDIFYCDGTLCRTDEAIIPLTGRSVLRGFGVFNFLRTYGGRPGDMARREMKLFAEYTKRYAGQ
jgi:hypothetical protein